MASESAESVPTKPISTPTNRFLQCGPVQLPTPESLPRVQETSAQKDEPETAAQTEQDLVRAEEDEAYIQFFRDGTTLLTELLESEGSSPESFWSRLEEYSVAIAGLFDRDSTGMCIVDRLIDDEEQDVRIELVKKVENRWCELATNDLARYTGEIETRLLTNPSISEEYEFAKLGRRVLFAVGAVPAPEFEVDNHLWVGFAPTCITEQTQGIVDHLHTLYNTFQQTIYLAEDIDEKLKLWYLISSNLKKIFYELSEYRWRSKGLLYSLEKEFSNNQDVRNWYQYTASMLDISCMQEFEDWVAEYCKFVYNRLGVDERSASTKLDDKTLSTLLQFGTSIKGKEQPDVSAALHKAVARLNYLLGGPKVLRRLGRKIIFYLADEQLRTEMRQDPDHEPLMPIRPLKPGWWPIAEDVFSFPVDLTREVPGTALDEIHVAPEMTFDDLSEPQAFLPRESYIPRGRNILSAYDYVYSNIPETRAFEVANSRLISRDLRDPGIVSRGLLVEDVINLPPLHCRTPGTWTTWKQRMPLGPYEIFTYLGSSLLRKIRGIKPRSLPRPLQPPSVTSRADCRHYKHKRKLSAEHRSRARVTKSKPIQRVGLRGGGGGPRYIPDPDESPSRHPRTAASTYLFGYDPEGYPIWALHDTPSPESDQENQTPHFTNAANNVRAPLGDITAATAGNGDDGFSGDQTDPEYDFRSPDYAESNSNQHHRDAFDTENDNDVGRTELSEATTELEGAEEIKNAKNLRMSKNPEPPNNPSTPDKDSIERCHPCPYYEGQFHHKCEGNCNGLAVRELRTPGVDEDAFFDGSLWEQHAPQQWERVENEIHSFRDFVTTYRWASSNCGLARRVFGLSNGAMIRISRARRGETLEFNFYQAARQPWATSRLDWTQIPREQFLEEMPRHIDYIQALRPGRRQYTITDYNQWSSIDDLRSPEWQTDTVFTIHFTDPQRNPFRVRLERAATSPRERLVIQNTLFLRLNTSVETGPTTALPQDFPSQGLGVPQAPGALSANEVQQQNQPEYTHIRDFDAPSFANLDQAIRNSVPGSAQLKEFQEKLANLKAKAKEEQEKRDEAQKQQAQQAERASGEAGHSATGGSAMVSIMNIVVDSQPQQIKVNPNPQVAAALAHLEAIRNQTAAPKTTVAPPASVPALPILATSSSVVVNAPVAGPVTNSALTTSQPPVPSGASQEPADQTTKVQNVRHAGAKDQKAGAKSGVKRGDKEDEAAEPTGMFTRAQAAAKAKKEKEEKDKEAKEKAAEEKEKNKNKNGKGKIGDSKPSGKGKNKRTADDDAEDADDEAGAAVAPPTKKRKKTGKAKAVPSLKKQDPKRKR